MITQRIKGGERGIVLRLKITEHDFGTKSDQLEHITSTL